MTEAVAHRIVESMGANWDAGGHQAPTNWHVICLCGWGQYGLPDQAAACDAWDAHRAAADVSELTTPGTRK